jgi:peptidoglycan-N-acetylglucosamine deacetylase
MGRAAAAAGGLIMKNIYDYWPDKTRGAVSLTFDDGIQTQLDNAIPVLDSHGLKGTFYVNPRPEPFWEERLERWQEASRNGHEIGNHTVNHPCSCNFGFSDEGYCLENLSLDDIADTIDRATKMLDEQFPWQKGERSFCYPCYQTYVGVGTGRRSYVPVVAERFKAARGTGERANHPELIDLSYIWSYDAGGHSAEDMIAYVEDAVQKNLWGIICMHGVGGEHISVSTEALDGLCGHLAENSDRIWTATVIEIANAIIDKR